VEVVTTDGAFKAKVFIDATYEAISWPPLE